MLKGKATGQDWFYVYSESALIVKAHSPSPSPSHSHSHSLSHSQNVIASLSLSTLVPSNTENYRIVHVTHGLFSLPSPKSSSNNTVHTLLLLAVKNDVSGIHTFFMFDPYSFALHTVTSSLLNLSHQDILVMSLFGHSDAPVSVAQSYFKNIK
jgi:hypothetical protein